MGGKVCAHIYRLFNHQYNYIPLYPVNPQILDNLIYIRLDKFQRLGYIYVMSGKVCAHIYRLFNHQYNYFPLYPVNPQILDILILTT